MPRLVSFWLFAHMLSPGNHKFVSKFENKKGHNPGNNFRKISINDTPKIHLHTTPCFNLTFISQVYHPETPKQIKFEVQKGA